MQQNQDVKFQDMAAYDGHVDDLTTSNEAVIDETTSSDEAETPNLAGLAEEIGKKATSTPKRARKNAGDLEAEEKLVHEILQEEPFAQVLAVAVRLGIPESRVQRYFNGWKSLQSPQLVVRPNKIVSELLKRLKTTSGDSLKADAPMKLEFDGNTVTITPYEG